MKLFSVNQGLSGQLGTLRTRYLNDKKLFLLGTSKSSYSDRGVYVAQGKIPIDSYQACA